MISVVGNDARYALVIYVQVIENRAQKNRPKPASFD